MEVLDTKLIDYIDKFELNIACRKVSRCAFTRQGDGDNAEILMSNSERDADIVRSRSLRGTHDENIETKIVPLKHTCPNVIDVDCIHKSQEEHKWSKCFGKVVWYRCVYNSWDQTIEEMYLPAYLYDPSIIESCTYDMEKMRVQSNFYLKETEMLRNQQNESVYYIYLYQHDSGGNGVVTLSVMKNILPFVSNYNQIVHNLLGNQSIKDSQKRKFIEALRWAQADACADNDVRMLGKMPNPIREWIITSTPFDIILSDTWRCSLCNGVSGLVSRCPVTSCSVRAHPICALLEGWDYCRVTVDSPGNGTEGLECSSKRMNVSFLCRFHSVKSKYKRRRKSRGST
tara:strand:+ start:28 stop:1056 length:1029 start_codon:yes stop_codon:yes gene_type:complete